MNIFKTFTLHWWQGSLFKVSMVAFGVAVATTWPGGFAHFKIAAWIVFAVAGTWITLIWARQ